MTANQLQIGDIFTKQGFTYKVMSIKNDQFKNGTKALLVGCMIIKSKLPLKLSNVEDSFFHFKLDTKIK